MFNGGLFVVYMSFSDTKGRFVSGRVSVFKFNINSITIFIHQIVSNNLSYIHILHGAVMIIYVSYLFPLKIHSQRVWN